MGAKRDIVGANLDQVGANLDRVGAKLHHAGANQGSFGSFLDPVGVNPDRSKSYSDRAKLVWKFISSSGILDPVNYKVYLGWGILLLCSTFCSYI